MTTPLRCLVWCAVSTPAQAEDTRFSLPKQETDARAVCDQNAWQIIDVLSIPGHSRFYDTIAEAAVDMRTAGIDALDRFMAHVERRSFDALIVRDMDRFGRTQSMVSEVMQKTYRAGARVYTTARGAFIEPGELNIQSAIAGFMSATDIERLIAYRHAGMRKKITRGLPVHKPPLSHMLIRDETGVPVKMVANPDTRGLIEDITRLIIEGVGWKHIEEELYTRYGHVNPKTSKPYALGTFRHLVYNPIFWGNSVYGRRSDDHLHIGLWVFDSHDAPPEHLHVFYGTHEPAITGELAERLKAEMRRRRTSAKGRSRPWRSTPFAGLLICGVCGSHMVYHYDSRHKPETAAHYLCPNFRRKHDKCTNKSYTRVRSIMTQFEAYLVAIREHGIDAILAPPRDDASAQVDAIDRDLDTVREQARALIRLQARNPALSDLYQDEIDVLQLRMERLDMTRRSLVASSQGVTTAQRQAVKGMSDPAVLWRRTDTEINQFLHTLLGGWRIEIVDRQITRLVVP